MVNKIGLTLKKDINPQRSNNNKIPKKRIISKGISSQKNNFKENNLQKKGILSPKMEIIQNGNNPSKMNDPYIIIIIRGELN